MKRVDEILGGMGRVDALRAISSRIEADLAAVSSLEDLQELLEDASILLRVGAGSGNILLPNLSQALRSSSLFSRPGQTSVVVGLGAMGGRVLLDLCQREHQGQIKKVYVDVGRINLGESGRGIETAILSEVEGSPAADVLDRGGYFKWLYRNATESSSPGGFLVESCGGFGTGVACAHVVASIEDPLCTILEELLTEIHELLKGSTGSRIVLHLVSRPAPRIGQSIREALTFLESRRPFHQGFLVCSADRKLEGKVSSFILLCCQAPEVLARGTDGPRQGPFSTYGVATLEPSVYQGSDLRQLEASFEAASPSWFSREAGLFDSLEEGVFLIHPPSLPPGDAAWKLIPSLVPVAVEGTEAAVCRIQHGVRVKDMGV